MKPPRIRSVIPKDDHFLIVEFEDRSRRLYDVEPLFERSDFAQLKNPVFFRAVKVDSGGYAVYWSEDLDLSENELWTKGKVVDS